MLPDISKIKNNHLYPILNQNFFVVVGKKQSVSGGYNHHSLSTEFLQSYLDFAAVGSQPDLLPLFKRCVAFSNSFCNDVQFVKHCVEFVKHYFYILNTNRMTRISYYFS